MLELCIGGDLQTLLRADLKLSEGATRVFAKDLAKALRFTHSKGYVHCDVRPLNILMNEYGSVKLSGFGISRSLDDSLNVNTPPLEVCLKVSLSSKHD